MSFRSYVDLVDFDGVTVPLPNTYNYISIDEFGFLQCWRNKPVASELGGFTGGNDLPITIGHNKDWMGLERKIRKYRRIGKIALISKNGVEE
ncbi:TPA: hypothetical protein ACQ75A_001021 [Escherichia coli]